MAEQEQKTQQEMSEILRVRREKLQALKDDGRDPYEVTVFEKNYSSEDILNNFDTLEGLSLIHI